MNPVHWLTPPRGLQSLFHRDPNAPPTNPARAGRAATLWKLFLLSYVALLVVAYGYIREIAFNGAWTVAFAAAVYLTYCVIYLLPVFFPILALNHLVSTRWAGRLCAKVRLPPGGLVYGLAVAGFSAVLLFVYSDTVIYDIYGFHFNGFVWNLIATKGGLESMGGDWKTYLAAGLLVVGFVGMEIGFLLAILKIGAFRRALSRVFSRRVIAVVVVGILAMTGIERIAYGVCAIYSYRPVLLASRAFLLYVPCTFKLPRWIADPPRRDEKSLRFKAEVTSLRYPLKPIKVKPEAKTYNIVWLVAESLRADMVDPGIMPATEKFARHSIWFKNHYSSGNGTRMGIFGMFYGLYGNYWFPFLDAARGPVLVDLLIEKGYQFGLYTSAKFTYPEFDKTIWARIDPSLFHECDSKLEGWENDRIHVGEMLKFIDNRDTARPFLTFLFFESPHARYYFPPESVIRKDYIEDFNYVTTDLEANIGLIKNRYINSCHHLDSQYARIFDYLKEHDLLDSTIVIVTGDHGEEFMEKGRWGHNSTFSEEQLKPPMILWVPGQPAREVESLTSHLDIAPTLMNLLGVANPPGDYCLGYDLLGDHRRDYAIAGDWNNLGYIGLQHKAEFSLQSYGFTEPAITTRDDQPVDDPGRFLRDRRDRLATIMKDMARFGK